MNMVKKEYITPAMEVVEMEVISMFAGSVDNDKLVGDYRDEDLGDDGCELSNRRRNFWDEVGRGW